MPHELPTTSPNPRLGRRTLRERAHQFYRVFETGDVASLDGVFDPAYIDHTPPLGRVPNRDGLKAAVVALRSALPDLHCVVEELLIDGTIVAVRARFTGTHLGVLGTFAPTGQPIAFIAFDMHRFGTERITESWHLEDNLTLFSQMGAMVTTA